jgi:hypothetical protein
MADCTDSGRSCEITSIEGTQSCTVSGGADVDVQVLQYIYILSNAIVEL